MTKAATIIRIKLLIKKARRTLYLLEAELDKIVAESEKDER